MVDNDFIKIKQQAKELRANIEKALENYKREGFENNRIYHELEIRYSENLDDLVRYIDYMQRPVKEYALKLRNDGRYETNDGSDYFTSGSCIEVYIDNEIGWCTGRVECRHEDNRAIYYFLNDDDKNIDLFEGMRIRMRK